MSVITINRFSETDNHFLSITATSDVDEIVDFVSGTKVFFWDQEVEGFF